MKCIQPIVVAILVVTSSVARATILSSASNPANGHIYYLLGNSTWTDAEAEAITLNGHLATVNDSAEQLWLLSTFSPNLDKHLWIGANDAASEGNFVWTNGEPLNFTNWGINQPDNFFGLEDYVYIDVSHNGNWNDLRNLTEQAAPGGGFVPLHGVVEVVPEPPAFASACAVFSALFWIVSKVTSGTKKEA